MKRILMFGLTLVTQAFGSVPQPDPVASIDEFGHAHIEWESVVGRTYFPRVSTDLVNWSYLPGEVFLGDGSVLQGLSFPPPLNDQTFVSLHFTDEPGADDLDGDLDYDGFTLQQELDSNTDPTLFDAGGGGTGYPPGQGPPTYPNSFTDEDSFKRYELIIEQKIPNQSVEFTVASLDQDFALLSINGVSVALLPDGVLQPQTNYGFPLKVGPEELEIKIHLKSLLNVPEDTFFETIDYKSYVENYLTKEKMDHLDLIKNAKGLKLSNHVRFGGAIPGTDLNRMLYPLILRFYRPTSDPIEVVEWNLSKAERAVRYDEIARIRVNGDDDDRNNQIDSQQLGYMLEEDDLSEFE
jgi:hypothetical protein